MSARIARASLDALSWSFSTLASSLASEAAPADSHAERSFASLAFAAEYALRAHRLVD